MMCSRPIARLFFCLSLLWVAAFAGAQTEQFLKEIRATTNQQAFERQVAKMPEELTYDINFDEWSDPGAIGANWSVSKARLIKLLEARVGLLPESGTLSNPEQTAKDILSGVQYRDAGTATSRNWLSRAFERIAEFIRDLLERIFGNRDLDMPDIPAPSPILGALTPIIWVIIGLAVILFLVFVIRKFRLGPRNKKVGGLLEDDEPERTADEWLSRADELTAEGRHREAIRCLYLACLVRFDDANVARFVRSETNWEHLGRISASIRKPETVDFRPATQEFDLVWYGYKPIGSEDVQSFRSLYQELCQDLNLHRAA